MTPPNFALYFTIVVNLARVTTSKHSLHFQSVDVGENVTLPCSCDGDAGLMFFWYKQTLGQQPKLVSTLYAYNDDGTFNEEFMNERFSLNNEKQTNQLQISELQISDSATYYCVKSNLMDFEFCNSITVSVKGSGLNVPVSVHQSTSEPIQPGGSVTLNCTVQTGSCDGKHSVYWFKYSEESHPGLIYSHGGRNDQCERNSNTQTHTCFYNLPMKSLNLSHAETYYCAVASCGHILFGDGTKLDIKDEVDYSVLVYFLSAALALTLILVVLLALLVYKMSRKTCKMYSYVKMQTAFTTLLCEITRATDQEDRGTTPCLNVCTPE
ncbi:immunoglobulin kappa light chain-like [Plectropomus leopardus]|uniref:immunoglobulin kappa light chain-like n=1 Tax=Plectropomus leopardus TaxID=160734 RepID=UPI001C4DC96B|nr:immunoglobulin kappa light chain-like [Plectropomus leopardus]